jgi:hypothetical protein
MEARMPRAITIILLGWWHDNLVTVAALTLLFAMARQHIALRTKY